MSNIETLKAMQCLIGSNCLVSTPETFYAGPKGYVSNTSLQNAIDEQSDSIASIINKLAVKISEEDLKTINGISLIGKGNIEISGQGGTVDLSEYLTETEADDRYPKKQDVVYNTENVLDLSVLDIKRNNGESFEDFNGSIQGTADLWITVTDWNTIYEFSAQTKYNALVYDGLTYYNVIGVYNKESDNQAYDNPIALLLQYRDTLYILKTGETSSVIEEYPVAIKLEVFVNNQTLNEANNYTNQKISKLDPQHILVTESHRDFSKKANVGRLLYLTEEVPLSFRFEDASGYSLYTKVYSTPDNYMISEVPAYTDRFLSELINSKYGEITFNDVYPYKLYSADGNSELDYKETVTLCTGIYYLSDVNNPILIASENSIDKLEQCITKEDAKIGFVEKTVLNYNSETVNLNKLNKADSLHVVQYDGYYGGRYYSDIAYITVMGPYVYVKGLVQVSNLGIVSFTPNNATDDLFYNKSANTWSKLQDASVKAELDSINNKVQENTRYIQAYGQQALKYYPITDLTEYEEATFNYGDTIEVPDPLDLPSYNYLIWKAKDGTLIYTFYFDKEVEYNWTGPAYVDRYMSGILHQNFELSNDALGLYLISNDYDGGTTKFYYHKQISQGLNDDIARKISIVTSQGFKTIVDL